MLAVNYRHFWSHEDQNLGFWRESFPFISKGVGAVWVWQGIQGFRGCCAPRMSLSVVGETFGGTNGQQRMKMGNTLALWFIILFTDYDPGLNSEHLTNAALSKLFTEQGLVSWFLPGITCAMVTVPGGPSQTKALRGPRAQWHHWWQREDLSQALKRQWNVRYPHLKPRPGRIFLVLQHLHSHSPSARDLGSISGGSSFQDELFWNNFPTVCDTDRLFFDTRRACLLAPAISFLDKHMYCSQGKENPTHYLCLSSLCPINNMPVYSWHQSILIHIQHCFPGFPFGHLSATH